MRISQAIIMVIFVSITAIMNIGCNKSLDNKPINKDGQNSQSKIVTYKYHNDCPADTNFQITVNNEQVFVYHSTAGSFAAFSCEGTVNIEVELPVGSSNITVSPQKYGIQPLVNANKITFQMPGPMLCAVMVNGLPALYIYANPIETTVPDPENTNVKYFKAGQIYEVGKLILEDNESLYIEGGAVVRGSVFASKADSVQISGYGVLDGSFFKTGHHHSIMLEACTNSVIEDIIMIEPTSWMIVLGLCEDILIRNIKQLSFVMSTDGIDIVGSKRIRILNSFLRNGDDCVVLKAMNMNSYFNDISMDYSSDIEDVEVNGCTVISYNGGQAFEIGHELSAKTVNNIRFINCDVLGVHGHGGVFGIHNSGMATISNVLYENIRVEHYYNKLVDLRIIKSRYSTDGVRGLVQNILFKNIDVTVSQYNPGYSVSLIGGYNENHTINNVVFDNFRMAGEKVMNADQLDLHTKQVKSIVFK